MTSLISLRLEVGQQETKNLKLSLSDDGVKAEVDVNINLAYEDYGIDINLNVSAEIELVCSRCIETFVKSIDIEHRIIIAQDEKGWELDDDTLDMGVVNLSSNTLDVAELIRQLLVESQDMRPLCSEDCQGLCPVCGNNLNTHSCSCNNDFPDPRWSKLKNIELDKEKEEV